MKINTQLRTLLCTALITTLTTVVITVPTQATQQITITTSEQEPTEQTAAQPTVTYNVHCIMPGGCIQPLPQQCDSQQTFEDPQVVLARREAVRDLCWLNRHPVITGILCTLPILPLPILYTTALFSKMWSNRKRRETIANLPWINRHPVVVGTLCSFTGGLSTAAFLICAAIIGDDRVRGKNW